MEWMKRVSWKRFSTFHVSEAECMSKELAPYTNKPQGASYNAATRARVHPGTKWGHSTKHQDIPESCHNFSSSNKDSGNGAPKTFMN